MSVRKITEHVLMMILSFVMIAVIGLAVPAPVKAEASEAQTQESPEEGGIVYTDGPTGFRLVKGKTYYYIDNKMQTGWKTIGGRRYYFTTGKNGKGVMQTGKRNLNNKWYFLDPYMKTGLIESGSKVYFANENGVLQSGWRTIEGKKWYFTSDKNRRFERLTGMQKIGKKWYFLAPEPKTGFFHEGGHLYYANGNGELQAGWKNIDGKTYYFFNSTVNGHVHNEAAVGKKPVSGTWYIFDKEEGYQKFGLQEYEGGFYYAGNKGKLQTGWQTVGGVRMYFDPNGNTKYRGHNGMLTLKKLTYLVKDGVLQYGVNDWQGEYYYSNSKGVLETGWKTVDGKTYYFLPKKVGNQPMRAAVKGWYTMGDTSYFFDEKGVMDPDKTVWVGMHQVNGVWHYYYPSDADGHKRGDKATGLIWYNGACYYYDPVGDPMTGWQKVDGNYAWFDEKGMYVQNKAAMKLTVIDYGSTKGSYGANYGDATLMESNGHYLLLDTCMPKGSTNVIKKLKSMGVKKLSVYISHYHDDHIGALPSILKDGYFSVEKIYLPDASYMYGSNKDTKWFTTHSDLYEQSVNLAKQKGVQVITLREGDSLDCGLVHGRVLFQQLRPEFTGNKNDHGQVITYINNHSLVTMFECGKFRFLTAGDLEKSGEQELLDRGINISADIFKLSHHGGSSSNIQPFLNAVGASVYYYTNPNERTKLLQEGWCKANVNYVQSRGGNLFHPLVNGHVTFSVTGGMVSVNTVRRSKTVDVKVKNILSGSDMTLKVRVQSAPNGKYKIHENMIPFYCDLK